MENKELLAKFDAAVAGMEKKAEMLSDEGVNDYIQKLKDQRGALIYALQNDDEGAGMKIIEIAVAFAKEVDAMEREKIPVWKSLLGKKGKIAKSSGKSKDDAKQRGFDRKDAHESEFMELREELAKRDVELEGLKGAYAKMSAEISQTRKKMEESRVREIKELQKQIGELKSSLEGVHGTMAKEFSSHREAYREFGSEMLHLAIKVAELEELMEKGDTITEIDVLDLHNSVAALEGKLSLVEAREKKKRVEFVEQMQKGQRDMLKKLGSKADTGKIVTAIKQHVSELQHEIEDRDKKIAAEMHVELKSSYYGLSEKVGKIEEALEKAKSKKDLREIQKKVEGLNKSIELVRKSEMEIERELQQQHLSDEALLQKIDSLSERVKRGEDMDTVETSDIYKTIEALEMDLRNRPGTKEVNSMMGSLGYVKGKLDKIEQHVLVCEICGKRCKDARGLVLHKKMAHRAKRKPAAKKKKPVKKKAPAAKKKKPAAKKAPAKKAAPNEKKPKKFFGLIGG